MNSETFSKAVCGQALPIPDTGSAAVPEWIQIMPAGEFSGRDGRGPWRLDNAEGVVAISMAQAPSTGLPVDYEHQTEYAPINGQPAPASGWIPELQARPDGIWARVDWTERAAAHVTAREYRSVSPVFLHGKDGEVRLIQSVALTNLPNLNLKSLARMDQKEGSMPLIKTLASMVKLPAETAEADVEKAVSAALIERDSLKALHSQLSALFGAEDSAELIKTAQSIKLRADTPDPTKFMPVSAYEAMHKEFASLKAASIEAEAERLLAKARAEGKIIPATEEHFKALARSDPKGFEQLMGVLPDLRPGAGGAGTPGTAAPPAADGTRVGALTDSEKAMCRAMGVSEESYIKAQKSHGGE